MANIFEVLNVGVEFCRSASLGVFLWFWKFVKQRALKPQDESELEDIEMLQSLSAPKPETDAGDVQDDDEEERPGQDSGRGLLCSRNLLMGATAAQKSGIAYSGLLQSNTLQLFRFFARKGLPPLDNSPLSFFDEFHVVSGVPVFVLGRENLREDGMMGSEIHETSVNARTGDWLISSCCFSKDGSRLATGHSDGSVQIWDADHGRIMHSQKFHDGAVGDVSFQGTSAHIALSCDWLGILVVWNNSTGKKTVIDASPHWKGKNLLTAEVLQPCFSDDGLKVVFSLRVFRSLTEKKAETDQIVSLINIVESAPYARSNDSPCEECWFVVLNTKDSDHTIGHCSIPVSHDFTLTDVKISPSGCSLLAGFMDIGLTEGRVVVWPEYADSGQHSVTLQGTIGAWSPSMDMAVTWTVPADILPEKGDGGVCFLWMVRDFHDYAASNTSSPLQLHSKQKGIHGGTKSFLPHMLRSSWDGNVLWCDFVIHHDGTLQVVLCSVSETVHLEFWDTLALVPTRTVTPSISKLEVSLGKKDMWEKKSVRGTPVRGLKPVTTTRDRSWLGLVDESNCKTYIWNAAHGVEVFRLSFPHDLIARLGDQTDVVLGSHPGKFALIGDECLIICAPRPPSNDGCRGSLLASLKYVDSQRLDNLQQSPQGMFSHDGRIIGLLHPDSCVLHMWNIELGKKLPNISIPNGTRFLNFAISMDGREVLTSMSDNMLLLWRIGTSEGVQPGKIDQLKGDCVALGFSRDGAKNRTVVACESFCCLVWWVVEEVAVLEENACEVVPSWLSVKKAVKAHGGQVVPSFSNVGKNWKLLERVDVDASLGCRISSDEEEAIVISKGMEVVAWSLVHRMPLRKYEYQNHLDCSTSFLSQRMEASGASFFMGTKTDGSGFVRWLPGMACEDVQVAGFPRNMVTSGDGRWILYDELISSQSRAFSDGWSEACPDGRHRTVDTLKIVDSQGVVPPLEVRGANLVPSLLLLMSADGRRVASITTKYKIQVWSAYAATGLLPDYKLLKAVGQLGEKEYVKDLLEQMGPSLLNYAEPGGLSVLYHTLLDGRTSIRSTFLKWALTNEVKVAVLQLAYGGKWALNALDLALNHKKPSSAQSIMQFAMLGAAHDSDVAIMLQQSLVKLGAIYPSIFLGALEHKRMLLDTGAVQIPESLFLENREFYAATDIRMQPTQDQIQAIWDTEIRKKRKSADALMIPCKSKVIPLPEAAQLGSKGVLQNLLMSRASHSVYSSMPIKVIIWYKWKAYGYRMLINELWHYALLLLCFTAYSILLGSKEGSTGDDPFLWSVFLWKGLVTLSLKHHSQTHMNIAVLCETGVEVETQLISLLSAVLALVNLLRELKHMYMYILGYGHRGLLFWMTSGWNWMEMLSYMAAIAVPCANLIAWKSDGIEQSSIVATASIMLWGKVLYYARAFHPTGPLVIMIGEIIQDILFFMALAFMVLFGFGVAFFVLYHPLLADDSLTADMDPNTVDAVKVSFGTLGKSLMSVFLFMLGDFDVLVIYNSPLPSVSVFLFVLYMIIVMIILLNLLIAIMGDSFDRIKNSEETQFLKARASAIGDVEGRMSDSLRQQLEHIISPYVHVIMPVDARDDKSDEWQGRVRNLQSRLRRDARENLKHNQMAWKSVEEELKKINLQLRLMYYNHPQNSCQGTASTEDEQLDDRSLSSGSQPWGPIDYASTTLSNITHWQSADQP